MKNKFALILCFAIVILTGCTAEPTNSEDITNLIEAYIFAQSKGDIGLKIPDISDLSVSEKSEIINAISFDIVFNREDELITFLDNQWLDWRSDKGYITTYLGNKIDLDNKRLSSIKDTRKSVKVNAQFANVMEFYQGVGDALELQKYASNNLYVALDSQTFQFIYSRQGIQLIKASAVVFDMKKSDYYTAVFENDTLILSPVDTREMSSDNILIAKAEVTPFIDTMLPLIPWPENGDIQVSYTFFKEGSSKPYDKAILVDNVYTLVDEVFDVYENGYLQLSSEAYPDLPQFILYRPKAVAN